MHSNLNKHYSLSKDLAYCHGDNFDLYVDSGNNLTIGMSIPYLLYNHNYKQIQATDIESIFSKLHKETGIDFLKAQVLEFEYGAFEHTNLSATQYLQNTIGLLDFELLKKTSYMQLYGNHKIQYKLYDAVANAKRKKTFTRGNYPTGNLLKHELRFVEPKKVFQQQLFAHQLCQPSFLNELKAMLTSYKQQLITKKPIKHNPKQTTMTHLLFTALKNMESNHHQNIFSIVSELIDGSDLSYSQKSKRRKTLLELETTYNEGL